MNAVQDDLSQCDTEDIAEQLLQRLKDNIAFNEESHNELGKMGSEIDSIEIALHELLAKWIDRRDF